MYFVAQFHHSREVNQVQCATADEARQRIAAGNEHAAEGWRWGLSEINFTDDSGTPLTLEQANEIRRACGQAEY